jgi:hypothetical protein
MSINSFEGSDSHDEIVNERYWDGSPSSVDIIIPLFVDYLILIGALYFYRVEDDLTEMDVGYLNFGEESCVESVHGLVYDGWSNVELNWLSCGALNPKTGHEENDYIIGKRLGKRVVRHASCLLRVVYIFSKICK